MDDVILNTADKNLGLCINSTRWYNNEYIRQLSNTKVYQLVTTDVSSCINTALLDLKLLSYKHEHYLGSKTVSFLTSRPFEDVKIPSLNLSPKIHKLNDPPSHINESLLKGRPIINGFSSITVEPSKVLNDIIGNVLDQLELFADKLGIPRTIIKNSDSLLEDIKSLDLNLSNTLNYWLVTYDFESLSTNIHRSLLIDTLFKLKPLLNLTDELISTVDALSKFLSTHAYFHVGFDYTYKQIDGLTMGGYESVNVANLILRTAEINIFLDSKFDTSILKLYRFIDDGLCIIKGSYIECMSTLKDLFCYYPSVLALTGNVSKVSVDFLDLTLSIGHHTLISGMLEYRIFQKPFNTYSYVHYTSNHPRHVMISIIKGECCRYKKKSCNELEYNFICTLFKNRLKLCGFPDHIINQYVRKYDENEITEPLNNTIFNITTFDRRIGCDLLAKKILNKYKYQYKDINFGSRCQPKLRRLLLTKKKLHSKIRKYRLVNT